MAYPLILFDCDGTLVDSEHLNLKAIIDVIQECGVRGYGMDYGMNHFSGLNFSNIMNTISQKENITFPENVKERFLKTVRELAKTEMKAVDGAKEMVEAARQNSITYVVSNGERTNVLMSLEFVDIKDYFPDDRVISGAMAPNPKPAPDLFLIPCKRENIEPAKTLVIEDSVAGVTAGKAAGMDVWGFCGTHHDRDAHAHALKEAGADMVFHTMGDMRQYFESLDCNYPSPSI